MRSDVESSLVASFLPNAGIYGSSGTPSQKSLSGKIRLRFVITCLILLLTIAIGLRVQERGFLPFRIPSKPTSRLLCFESAYVAVSACPFGPKTPTALFAAKSWTNGATTPSCAGAVVIG